jgi:hypothetical protein
MARPCHGSDRNPWGGDHNDRLSGRNSAELCFISAQPRPVHNQDGLSQDRGCTFPGCTVPGYGCQVHHAELDWAEGGQTNITDECLACGPHNRMVKSGGWRTRKRKDVRTEWIPPHLDSDQSRVNNSHHPQNYLLPDEDDESQPAPRRDRSRSPSAAQPASCQRQCVAAHRRRTASPWPPWPARKLAGQAVPSA